MGVRGWARALLLVAAAGSALGNTTQLVLVNYDLTTYPLAVCNDGSAGAGCSAGVLGKV